MPYGTLLVAAAALLAVTMRRVGSPTLGTLAALAVLLVVASSLGVVSEHTYRSRDLQARWLVSVLGLGYLFFAFWNVSHGDMAYGWFVGALGATGLWVAWRLELAQNASLWVTTGLALVILGIVSVVAIQVLPDPVIDVMMVNEAGADALANGDNPYVAVVVDNTNPFASAASEFVGYVYPPVALVTYSLSEWFLGDTRWANVIAVGIFVLVLASPWRKRESSLAKYVMLATLAMVLLPSLTFLLRHGWTEPIALPFFGAAVLTWRKQPVLSAVLLGLAFATKQYFVLLAPLLLAWDDEFRWRRVVISGGVVVATLAPFVALDPGAFWEAVVGQSLTAATRPDSINLIAIGFSPPSWMASAAAVLVALVVGRRGGEGAEFAVASAAVLATAFLFGFQAFSNYWFLIVALGVIGLVAALDDSDPGEVVSAEGTIEQAAHS